MNDRALGTLIDLAVGDALAVEFAPPGSFRPVTDDRFVIAAPAPSCAH